MRAAPVSRPLRCRWSRRWSPHSVVPRVAQTFRSAASLGADAGARTVRRVPSRGHGGPSVLGARDAPRRTSIDGTPRRGAVHVARCGSVRRLEVLSASAGARLPIRNGRVSGSSESAADHLRGGFPAVGRLQPSRRDTGGRRRTLVLGRTRFVHASEHSLLVLASIFQTRLKPPSGSMHQGLRRRRCVPIHPAASETDPLIGRRFASATCNICPSLRHLACGYTRYSCIQRANCPSNGQVCRRSPTRTREDGECSPPGSSCRKVFGISVVQADPAGATLRERLIACVGALVGITLTG